MKKPTFFCCRTTQVQQPSPRPPPAITVTAARYLCWMDTNRTIAPPSLFCYTKGFWLRCAHPPRPSQLRCSSPIIQNRHVQKKFDNNPSLGENPCYWLSQFNNATAGGTEKSKCFCGQATTNLPSPISPALNPLTLILPLPIPPSPLRADRLFLCEPINQRSPRTDRQIDRQADKIDRVDKVPLMLIHYEGCAVTVQAYVVIIMKHRLHSANTCRAVYSFLSQYLLLPSVHADFLT